MPSTTPEFHEEKPTEPIAAPSSPPSANSSLLATSPTLSASSSVLTASPTPSTSSILLSTPSASTSVTSVVSTILDTPTQKPLPLLPSPRAVAFAPLPITEPRERKHPLGMAGRARMLRERRERRFGGDVPQWDDGRDRLAAPPGDGLGGGALQMPWQEDPLVKLGRRLVRGLKKKLSQRAAGGCAAEEDAQSELLLIAPQAERGTHDDPCSREPGPDSGGATAPDVSADPENLVAEAGAPTQAGDEVAPTFAQASSAPSIPSLPTITVS